MTQNGLIKFTEKLRGVKIRKVYHLTQKGRKSFQKEEVE